MILIVFTQLFLTPGNQVMMVGTLLDNLVKDHLGVAWDLKACSKVAKEVGGGIGNVLPSLDSSLRGNPFFRGF